MAEEVYRIEIPVTVEDNTDPALSNAEKKVSKFDQTADRTQKRLDKMNRTRWQLAVHVLDRASAMINHIGALARRVAGGTYRITVRVLDMATAPFRAVLRGMNSALGILGIGAGTAGGIVVPIKMVIQQQSIETAFEVLLGSADAAKQRVAELIDFAGQTPFARDEIFEASRILEVFTKGVLSQGDGLRMVGDIASATQNDLANTALWMGRLYDSMKAGRKVGEETSRLQEMGAIDGDARNRLEALAEAPMEINEKWALAVQEFQRYDGMMKKMSDNLANLLLGVKSFFNNTFVKRWGEGLAAGITPMLQAFRQWRRENPELIAQIGNQVERVATQFSRFFVDRIEIMARKLNELFDDEQFKNADLFGKVRIAWDKLVVEPFASWWAGGGKEKVDAIAANIGGALGAGLNSILLGLFGMGSETEAKISESPFIEAGASAGRSFLSAFLEAFDAQQIAQKAIEAFKNIQPTWLGGETSSGLGQALVLLFDAWLISKVGKLLKGPFKVGRAITRWARGGSTSVSAAETAATTAAAATRTSATAVETATRAPWYKRWFGGSKGEAATTAAETTARAPWYRRWFGGSKGETATTAAEATPRTPWYRRLFGSRTAAATTAATVATTTVPRGPAAHLPQNYRPAGTRFWENIPLDRVHSRDEVVRMANAGQLQRYNDLEKAFGGPVAPKTPWWQRLLPKGGGGRGMGIVSRTMGRIAVPLGIGLDVANIAAAEPGQERNRAIGGTVGGWGGFAAGAAGGAAIGSVIPGIGTAIGGLIGGILGGLGGGAIGEWLGSQFDQLGDIAQNAWDGVKRIAGDTWNWISDTAPQAIARGIGFAVGYIGDTLFSGEWWGEKWAAVQAWSEESWQNAQETWNNVMTAIGDTIFSGEWWAEKWQGVQDWAADTWESAKDIWNNARTSIEDTLFNGDWWKGKWSAVESWASSAWESIKGGWNRFWGKVSSAFSEGKEAGQQAAGGGAKAYARGGFINRPHLGLVGEAGPEVIIPLSARMRNRGLDLWESAGRMLGVQPYAFGGIVGAISAPEAPMFAPVAPMAPIGTGTGLTIHLGGVQISITVENGDGQSVIEAIREHGDEIADEIAEKIGARLDESTTNSV